MIREQAMCKGNLRNKYPSVDPAEFDHIFQGYKNIRDNSARDMWCGSIDLNDRESVARAARNMPPQ